MYTCELNLRNEEDLMTSLRGRAVKNEPDGPTGTGRCPSGTHLYLNGRLEILQEFVTFYEGLNSASSHVSTQKEAHINTIDICTKQALFPSTTSSS
jgi:hypothetical protein